MFLIMSIQFFLQSILTKILKRFTFLCHYQFTENKEYKNMSTGTISKIQTEKLYKEKDLLSSTNCKNNEER